MHQFCYRLCVAMLVKMFFLAVILDLSFPCQELHDINVLDFSEMGLKDLRPIYHQTFNFTVKCLLLQENVIISVNFSMLVLMFPGLQMVDLRHNPFDCKIAKTAVEVLASCSSIAYTSFIFCLTSTGPTSTTPIHPSSTTIPKFLSLTTVPSTPGHSFTGSNDTRLTILLASIVPSCAFVIILILCVLRIKIRKYYRRHSNSEMQQFANPLGSSGSEETLFEQSRL